MAKKATEKKPGIVMATRGPKELHRAVRVAAKKDGITLGQAILRGLELYLAAPRK